MEDTEHFAFRCPQSPDFLPTLVGLSSRHQSLSPACKFPRTYTIYSSAPHLLYSLHPRARVYLGTHTTPSDCIWRHLSLPRNMYPALCRRASVFHNIPHPFLTAYSRYRCPRRTLLYNCICVLIYRVYGESRGP